MSKTNTGGCLCGKVRYSVSQPLEKIIVCHCTNCQRASGTGATQNAVVPTTAFTLTSGILKRFDDVADSGNILHRYFCGDCGSPIYNQRSKMPQVMTLKVGTLDDSNHLKVVMNIWTKSARPWMTIDPNSECHAGNRPV